MKVLVTGANGFVGRAVLSQINGMSGMNAVGTISRAAIASAADAPLVMVGKLSGQTNWSRVLANVQAVIHLAGRVHVKVETAADPLEEFRRVNVQVTLNLARQAAAAGVRRFVFISSIGVNGAETFQLPFTDKDCAAPHSPYAVSKYEAELGLQALAAETGIDVVIIRPPLVYGPGAPGNFGSLIRWLKLGVPLPLGAIHNQRSLVALGNLVDLIVTCLNHPAAANQTFLVSDGEDISTTDLLRRLRSIMGKPARLIPIPVGWLSFGAKLLGKREIFQSLCGTLQVDISKTSRLLNWKPPVSVDEGLRRAVQQNCNVTGI